MQFLLRGKRLASLLAIFSLSFLALNLFSAKTYALGPGFSLTTSPVSVILRTAPGTSTTTNLQFQNSGSQAVNVGVKLDVFSAYGVKGQAQITPPTSTDTYVNWVHFSQTSFLAEPAVWNQLKVTINVPKSGQLGYYYAVVFSPQTGSAVTSKSNTVHGSAAVLALLEVPSPNEHRLLQVNSFSANKRFYEYLPATFTVLIKNEGNIFTQPEGDVFISRTPSGSSLATLDVNPNLGNVLPNSSRQFQVSWSNGFPNYQLKRVDNQIISDKKGNPVMQLQWNFAQISHFRIGRYYAHLALAYNNGTQEVPIDSVVSFWVVPWKLLLIVVVISALIIFGIVSIFRNLYRRIRGIKRPRK